MAGAGFTLSAVGHAGLLAGVLLLLSPQPFETVPSETIAVDLVPETELAAAKAEPPPEPEKAKFGLDTAPARQPAATQPPPAQHPVATPPAQQQAALRPQPVPPVPQPPAQSPPPEPTKPASVFDPLAFRRSSTLRRRGAPRPSSASTLPPTPRRT